jgi:hypothetical protein
MMDPWKALREANVEAWSKAMVELVNTEAFAQANGALLDQYLTMSQPFRQVLEKTMAQALTASNMPTRDEVLSLAERLTSVQMLLDDLDARLERLEAAAGLPAAGEPGLAARIERLEQTLDARLARLEAALDRLAGPKAPRRGASKGGE